MKITYILLLAAPLWLTACGGDKKPQASATTRPLPPINKQLQARLDSFARQPRVKGAFGFHVYDLTADRSVTGFQQDVAQPSASCLKIITGVAAMKQLGANHTFISTLSSTGAVQGGTLHGTLYWQAGLDPQLQPEDLRDMAKTLRQKGVQRVTGKIVMGLGVTEPVRSERHWFPWDLSFSRYGLLYKGEERIRKEMKAALTAQGITVADSQIVNGKTLQGTHIIWQLRRPIKAVIKRMWKNSSNTQATSLLMVMGKHANPNGNTAREGVLQLHRFVQQQLHLPRTAYTIHDGCGLCIHNRLSPRALTQVLRYAYQRPAMRQMMDSCLSISGVDGTLMREFSSPKLRGRIHGKTGTLSHPYGISSLAGICQSSDGHILAFAIMDHNMSVLDARVLQRKLCELLVK